MTINLLKVAALPGSGAGIVSALKAEVSETKPLDPNFGNPARMALFVQMPTKDDRPGWLRLGAAMPSSPYFEGHEA